MAVAMKKFDRNMKIVNITLIAITALFVLWFLYFTIRACVTSNLLYLTPINTVISAMYCLLGTVFFTVGVTMIVLLAKHFPEFYKNYRCLLWMATILLTLPLFIRTAKDY